MKNYSYTGAFLLVMLTGGNSFAQSKIKDGSIPATSSLPDANAILELESNSKGFLLPRLALSSTTAFTPLSAHVAGITAYNTATAGDVTPGYYYNDGTKWVRIADATAADLSKDAWIDDNANTQVKLGTLSNGSTARADSAAFVAKDNGHVGIGLSNPAGQLDINGKMYVRNQQTVYNAAALGPTIEGSSHSGSLFIGDGGQSLSATPTGIQANNNTAMGISALYGITTGSDNTAVGSGALNLTTTSTANTALGSSSLHNTTTGSSNTAIGNASLLSNITGTSNVAVGTYALYNSISGASNVAMGENALLNAITGSYGVAIGYSSQQYANSVNIAWNNYNTSVGAFALRGSTTSADNTGNYNTVIGYESMYKNTAGASNTALGTQSLYNNTTGNNNTTLGYKSLYNNTTGNWNIGIGNYSLNNNTIGTDNIGIGFNALYNTKATSSVNGESNVGIGTAALLRNVTGRDNVALGINTLSESLGNLNTGLGYRAGTGITTGSNNIILGGLAGSGNSIGITTGSNNTVLGSNIEGLAATLSNNIVIADGQGNQRIRVTDNGNTGIGTTTPQKKLHVNGTLQVTNELNVGGTATTAGSAGTVGQVLTSNGPGAAPSWQALAGATPTSNGTIIVVNGSLLVAQEIVAQLATDFTTSSAAPAAIGLDAEVFDNENTFTGSTTANSFSVTANGLFQVTMNLQLTDLASPPGTAGNTAIGLFDNTDNVWVARMDNATTADLQMSTLMVAVNLLTAHTYSFKASADAGHMLTIKAKSMGAAALGSVPVSQVSVKRLK